MRSRKEDVQLIESPVGLAARAIRNSFLEKVEKQGRIPVQRCYQCMNHCKQAETKYCISQALIDAVQGREGLVFCGANAYEIEKLSTVEKVMQEVLFCYSLSVMVLCSSCRDLTTPQPGLFMDSIPEAVAFAAAMVVM